MDMASGPETRTTAIAPKPCGVAMAQIVSLFKMLVCMILILKKADGLLGVIPEAVELTLIASPIFIDLHVSFQEDALAEDYLLESFLAYFVINAFYIFLIV